MGKKTLMSIIVLLLALLVLPTCTEGRQDKAPNFSLKTRDGKVVDLEKLRGAPLPSAKEFNHLAPDHKRAILTASFAEMRRLGIHYDFAPVIDVDYNPDNPNIGRIKRSFSADIAEVEANALL